MVVIPPLIIMSVKFRNQKIQSVEEKPDKHPVESNIMLFTGVGLLIFVPIFKTLTHMPPYMGMLLALGIIWVVSSLIHLGKNPELRYRYSVTSALKKIDTGSILFFLGILLAVGALQSFGILEELAQFTCQIIFKILYITGTILGTLFCHNRQCPHGCSCPGNVLT